MGLCNLAKKGVNESVKRLNILGQVIYWDWGKTDTDTDTVTHTHVLFKLKTIAQFIQKNND